MSSNFCPKTEELQIFACCKMVEINKLRIYWRLFHIASDSFEITMVFNFFVYNVSFEFLKKRKNSLIL